LNGSCVPSPSGAFLDGAPAGFWAYTIRSAGWSRSAAPPAALPEGYDESFRCKHADDGRAGAPRFGCQAPESGASAPAAGSQPILSRDLDKVSLGKTSPADVEGLFGLPEERLADGTSSTGGPAVPGKRAR
jgi:hypothetical protein